MDPFLFLLFLLFLLIVLLIIKNKKTEHFKNIYDKDSNTKKNYLFPIKGLQSQCEEEGLYPSFMPKICTNNGKMNTYANCKCEDENGECKICYPTINQDKTGAQVVFNSTTSDNHW